MPRPTPPHDRDPPRTRLQRWLGPQAAEIARRPGTFALTVIKAFRANQGLLLAGAVAYYAMLSIVPLLILMVIALSHWIETGELLAAIGRYLEWLLPGQSGAVMQELRHFLDNREVVSGLLALTMLFFSSLAFTVLENAMSVIFVHRVATRRRRFLVSALLPYGFVLSLGLGLMLVTLVSGSLQALGEEQVALFGRDWSLVGLAGLLLWGLGFAGEVLLLTSLYLVLPVGRLSLRHALVGGVTAAVLWEITRRLLIWYLTTLSQVNVVYGSLTTAIIVLLSLELAATLLLFGAQVIAEYERLARKPMEAPPVPFHTD